MSPLVIGILIIVLCGAFGVFLAIYLGKRQDRRRAEIERTLESYPAHWSSVILDPKFSTRGFLKSSVSFGDLKVSIVPDGFLLKDGEAYHFLYLSDSSAMSRVANKSYALDFLAIEESYIWISGGEGQFRLRGNLSGSSKFRALAAEWNWPIHEGVPHGAVLPRRYKG